MLSHLGYKGDYIRKWMRDYLTLSDHMTINTEHNEVVSHGYTQPNWTIDLIDTGLNTQTGGRIKRLQQWLGNERFMLTWGDGVSNINLRQLLDFHLTHGKLATMTIVRPKARFGHITLDGNQITQFTEKPQTAEGWVNGAFFVLEPGIFDYIEGDATQWEHSPLEQLAQDGELMAYKHDQFWQCMDTLNDKRLLQQAWDKGIAPWKVWE